MAKDFISDEEMAALEKKDDKSSPDFISDKEMADIEKKIPKDQQIIKEKSIIPQGILSALEKYESYTGAPIRAGIGALQTGKSPIEEYKKAFGTTPITAPTGEEISKKAGIPESIAPYTGFGIDVLATPETFIPSSSIAKVAGKVSKGIGKILPKIGEAFTGLSHKDIETFSKSYNEVNSMLKKYKDVPSDAADEIRRGYQSKIQTVRRAANEQIGNALEKASPEKNIDITKVFERLDQYKARINPTLNPEQVSSFDKIIERISALAPRGKVSTKEAYDITQYLADIAEPAYDAVGKKIFTSGKQVAEGAKQASRITRNAVNEAMPSIKDANQKLSALRSIENNINKNLINPLTPESGLIAAGRGSNIRNLQNLKRLESITGQSFIPEAKQLSAFQSFRELPLLPIDVTGKVVARTGLGGLLGYQLGGTEGAILGAGLTSPAALKLAIQSGKFISPIGNIIPSAATTIRGLQMSKALTTKEKNKRLKALEESK